MRSRDVAHLCERYITSISLAIFYPVGYSPDDYSQSHKRGNRRHLTARGRSRPQMRGDRIHKMGYKLDVTL